MDDPLIGLTIYDTTKSKIRDVNPGNSSAVQNDRMSINGTRERKPANDDTNEEECFPCMPSLPENQEREVIKPPDSSQLVSDSSSRGAAVPPHHEHELIPKSHPSTQPKNFWLMRLFQSNLFDMSIAIGYLFNSKDHSVQSYLGSRLFVSAV